MSFQEIFLHSFGAFEEKNFSFPAPTGLFIIMGDNETGKSTLFHAMRTILAGFRPATAKRNPFVPKDHTVASLEALFWDGTRVTRRLSATPSGYLMDADKTLALVNAPIPPLETKWVEQLYSLGPTKSDPFDQKAFLEILEEFLWPKQSGQRSLKEAKIYCATKRRGLYVPRKDGRGELNLLIQTIDDLDRQILSAKADDRQMIKERIEAQSLRKELDSLQDELEKETVLWEKNLQVQFPLTPSDMITIRQRVQLQEQLSILEEEIDQVGGKNRDGSFSPDALADLSATLPVFWFSSVILFVNSLVLALLRIRFAFLPFLVGTALLGYYFYRIALAGLRGIIGWNRIGKLKELGSKWYAIHVNLPPEPTIEKMVFAKVSKRTPEAIESFFQEQQSFKSERDKKRIELLDLTRRRDEILWRLSAIEERARRYMRSASTSELEDLRESVLIDARKLDTQYAGWSIAEVFLETLMENKVHSVGRFLPTAASYLEQFSLGRWRGVHRVEDGFLLEDHEGFMIHSSSQLSRGTADQFLLSLRLAMLDTFEQRHPFPLLLDESLVHWDKNRQLKGLQVLADVGKTRAVYLFTAHADESLWENLSNTFVMKMEELL